MKKAILVVSFGTTYIETRKKTIESCENRITEAYPDYDVFRAFTSNMVINRIKKQEGISIPTTEEALVDLKEKGYQEVIIQPLHVIPGSEYHKVVKQASLHRQSFETFAISRPLLNDYDDYLEVIKALATLIPTAENEVVLLMAHGSEHPSFSAYACLDHMLVAQPIHVCCVESYPHLGDAISKFNEQAVTKVHLYPFMLVAGDHATNDMASDEEDSWKSQLLNQGFEVETHLVGLGESPLIQTIYLNHLATAMKAEA